VRTKIQRAAAAGGLVAAGAVAGGILAGTLSANAAAPSTTTAAGESSTSQQAPVDESKPQRPDEQLLTGDTKSKVEAAVLAKYPGATIQRTETDSDGVYESHVVTTDGQHLIVQVGKDFAVTGTESGPGGGPGGGHHGGPRGTGAPAGGQSGTGGSGGA
jgi:hypothetical protein